MSSSNRTRHPHRKRWGQNFLRNPAAVKKIAAAVDSQPGEMIVEIGPGDGALTEELVSLGAPLRLIEIDPMLIGPLRERFGGEEIEIIQADALEAELPQQPFRAVGNLPYNVANPIIRRVLATSTCRRAVFMVQREVADRFTARPGDDAYGFLTLVTALYAHAEKILTLGPSSFHPRPKVASAVVRFDVGEPDIENDRETMEKILSLAFRQRRKKLSRNLEGFHDRSRDDIERALEKLGIDPSVRAERLELTDFDRLTTLL